MLLPQSHGLCQCTFVTDTHIILVFNCQALNRSFYLHFFVHSFFIHSLRLLTVQPRTDQPQLLCIHPSEFLVVRDVWDVDIWSKSKCWAATCRVIFHTPIQIGMCLRYRHLKTKMLLCYIFFFLRSVNAKIFGIFVGAFIL